MLHLVRHNLVFSNSDEAQGCIGFVSNKLLTNQYNAASISISKHPLGQELVYFGTALNKLAKFQLACACAPCSKITSYCQIGLPKRKMAQTKENA